MTALEYIQSLIEGQKISDIPIQICELEFLKSLLIHEKKTITKAYYEFTCYFEEDFSYAADTARIYRSS
jgi:hypothetical protein